MRDSHRHPYQSFIGSTIHAEREGDAIRIMAQASGSEMLITKREARDLIDKLTLTLVRMETE